MTGDADVTNEVSARAGRRPILKGALALAAVGTGSAAVRLAGGHNRSVPAEGALQLSSHVQPGMDTLEVPVRTAGVRSIGVSHWRSEPLDATTFSMVGFIWASSSPQAPSVRVRTRRAGAWSSWWPLPAAHEQPGANGAASDHTGTELVWVGRSDGVQFDVRGLLAPSMKLVLLYPRPLPSDTSVPAVGPAGAAIPATLLQGTTSATDRLRPAILSRAVWGADESWRDGAPRYNHAFQQVHVHHTASRNDYAAADVPALIRGMYRYHTHNLGWSDLAYNFLVDRFGRVWEGRAGGVARRVRGAHTLGFNATSAGIAVIGNFEIGTPDSRIPDAIASVAAWKLSRWAGNPLGTVGVVSEGSDLFAAGRRVVLPVIDGHRDTNQTACPGSHLYALLPQIRRRANSLMEEAAKTLLVVTEPASVAGEPEPGQTLSVDPGRVDAAEATFSYAWMRNDTPIHGATRPSYVCGPADFGTRLSVAVTAAAAGRLPVTQVVTAGGAVTALPTINLVFKTARRRAGLTASVVAPADMQRVPAGTVRLQVGGRERTVRLVNGVATSTFYRLRNGTKRVRATYVSDNGYESATAESSLVIDGR